MSIQYVFCKKILCQLMNSVKLGLEISLSEAYGIRQSSSHVIPFPFIRAWSRYVLVDRGFMQTNMVSIAGFNWCPPKLPSNFLTSDVSDIFSASARLFSNFAMFALLEAVLKFKSILQLDNKYVLC
jgi:hypothetical protein